MKSAAKIADKPISALIEMCNDMTVSLFARKLLGSWSVMLATCGMGFAQAPLTNLGPEYPIAGSLIGPQMQSAADVNSNGGFLVWEDLAADNDGSGIMAQALNNRLSGSGAPFRVNQWRRGDQEKPQVAILGEGTLFLWQGGQAARKHISTRLLTRSNAWAGGELIISAGAFHSVNPSLARLANGNAVAVYSSFNQRGTASMWDIYARLISPAGQPIGAEFPVNQIMTFNQRTPSVAALSDGRFVAVWVSESQRSELNVDIFGRIFDADGVPVASEFLVNSGTNLCANPSVVGAANGGFVVGWSQKAFALTNGWEVMARSFDVTGAPLLETQLNVYRHGDQMAPRGAMLNGQYLFVWTSLLQDGFSEGVFGRYLDAQGAPLGGEFKVNTDVRSRQIHPAVASDGGNRLLAVWSSLTAGIRNNFDLAAQKYASAGYSEPALAVTYAGPSSDPLPMDPPIGNPGSGDGTGPSLTNWISGLPSLAYPQVPATPGGAIGLAAAAGYYHGLVFDTNGVKVANSGSAAIQVSAGQTYSMKLTLGRVTYGFGGPLTPDGRATRIIPRSGGAPLRVDIQVDLAGGEQVTGRVTDGPVAVELVADKQVYNARSKPAPQAGNYTVRFPASDFTGGSPLGDGYGTVRIDGSGNVYFAGLLADGTVVSQKTAISRHGVWPLYASLYGGAGMLQSWMKFEAAGGDDLAGQVIWIKQAGVPARPYAAGFTNELAASGSRYATPAVGQKVLPITAGQVIMTGGGFGLSVTNRFALATKNVVQPENPAALKLSFVPSTGLFRGTVLQDGRKMTFQGVLDSKDGVGTGFFLNNNLSGQVYLGAEQ
jgi:hypothetical protein